MPETNLTEDWTIERFREGDEAEVLGLFAAAFGFERSREHWNWQFRDNPYGGPFVCLARSRADRSVVGSYSVMPLQLNLMGRPIPACQSVDTAVHAEWRNRKIFAGTARDCYAWSHERGLQGVYGFPSARSYPGLMRSLDWRRVAFPHQYLLRLDIGRRLARNAGVGILGALLDAPYRLTVRTRLAVDRAVRRLQAGAAAEIRTSNEVPDDYDQLWAHVRSQEVLSIWKDATYLRWRYDRNPDHDFRHVAVRRGGQMLAMAVTVDLGGTVTICELLVRDRDVPLGRLLVLHIAREALDRGANAVEFIAHDIGFFDEVFEGFARRLSTANVFCSKAFEPGSVLAELSPHGDNWTVTFGDGDFV